MNIPIEKLNVGPGVANDPSNSNSQTKAGEELIERLGEELHEPLTKKKMNIPGTECPLELDGVSDNKMVYAEAYARVGELKPAQEQKVATDILRLALVTRGKESETQRYLVFGDEEAANAVRGRKWLACACEVLGVEVRVFEFSKEKREELENAQKGQARGAARKMSEREAGG